MSVDVGGLQPQPAPPPAPARARAPANMTHPGHWVVDVRRLQRGRVYLCDPGAVLSGTWATVGAEPALHDDHYRQSLRDHPEWYQDPAFTNPPSPGSYINVEKGSNREYVDLDEGFQFALLDTKKVGPSGEPPGDLTRYYRRPPLRWLDSLILLASASFPRGRP